MRLLCFTGEFMTNYEIGEEIKPRELNKKQIYSETYGKLWVVKTGVVGDLWVSEDIRDLRRGRGNGLRYGYVEAVKLNSTWYGVEWDKYAEYYTIKSANFFKEQPGAEKAMTENKKIKNLSNKLLDAQMNPFGSLLIENNNEPDEIEDFMDDLENKHPDFTRYVVKNPKKFHADYTSGEYIWKFISSDGGDKLKAQLKKYLEDFNQGWKLYTKEINYDAAAAILYKPKSKRITVESEKSLVKLLESNYPFLMQGERESEHGRYHRTELNGTPGAHGDIYDQSDYDAFEKRMKDKTANIEVGAVLSCNHEGRIEIIEGAEARSADVEVGNTLEVTEITPSRYYGKLDLKGKGFQHDPGLSGKKTAPGIRTATGIVFGIEKNLVTNEPHDFFATWEVVK